MTQVSITTIMARMLMIAVVLATFAAPLAPPAQAVSRIKDIADFEGVRDNVLIGYGIVAGLNNTGDDLTNTPFVKESLVGMLERLGVNIRTDNAANGGVPNLKPKNVAAVMVTATLPAFARQGTRIDVSVSAMGDAKSLLGGTLLVTPLVGADGEIYAVAQGQVAGVGISAQGASGSSVTRGVPTGGRVSNGAIVERELPFQMDHLEQVNLNLRNPDFTTARRIAQAVNSYLGSQTAVPTDPSTVRLSLAGSHRRDVVALLTDIEQLRVEPDQVAKIAIDESTGTIVMGENVRVSTVAIAQGQLTIRITETPQVSQPSPFSTTGTTEIVQRSDIQIDEQSDNKLAVMKHGVSIQDLVNGLNALGVGPRDLIPILQTIKAAGALQAEMEVR